MILESTATLLTSPTTTMTSTTTSLEPPGSFSINFRLFTLYIILKISNIQLM